MLNTALKRHFKAAYIFFFFGRETDKINKKLTTTTKKKKKQGRELLKEKVQSPAWGSSALWAGGTGPWDRAGTDSYGACQQNCTLQLSTSHSPLGSWNGVNPPTHGMGMTWGAEHGP